MRNKLSRLMVLGMLCLVPTMVLAHEGTGSPGGFASGFLHPVLGLDHLLVVLAVGIWGARIGGRAVWTLIVAFPLFAGAGGFLGMIGVRIPFVDFWIALSMVAFGLAIVTGVRPPEWAALSLTGLIALLHGHTHGTELLQAAHPLGYGIGFVLATAVQLVGIGLGLLIGPARSGRSVRFCRRELRYSRSTAVRQVILPYRGSSTTDSWPSARPASPRFVPNLRRSN